MEFGLGVIITALGGLRTNKTLICNESLRLFGADPPRNFSFGVFSDLQNKKSTNGVYVRYKTPP